MHVAGQHVRTAGGRVWIETEGDGPPVLLAGGGPGVDHSHFHPWFSRLAERHTVVYVDWPGTGRSDDGPHSPAAYAEVLADVGTAVSADTFAVVALSFGGIPALALAVAAPERVERLVLSCAQFSASAWQAGNIDNVNAAMQAHFPERWQRREALRAAGTLSAHPDYQALYDGMAERLVWADPVGHEPLWREPDAGFSLAVYRAWLGDDPEWIVGGSLAGFDPALHLVAAPTLVITGRWDGMLTPALAAQLQAGLPAAELQIFEGAVTASTSGWIVAGCAAFAVWLRRLCVRLPVAPPGRGGKCGERRADCAVVAAELLCDCAARRPRRRGGDETWIYPTFRNAAPVGRPHG